MEEQYKQMKNVTVSHETSDQYGIKYNENSENIDHEENNEEISHGLSDVRAKTNTDERFHFCNPCLFDDAKETAVGFCIICVEYLCQGCCRDHKKSKLTRNHAIIKDILPEDASIFQLMKEMTSCSEHPDLQVTHKCGDHEAFVCVMCIAGNHRKCEHVKELQKEQTDNEITITEAGAKLEEICEKSKEILRNRQENIETLVNEKQEIQAQNAAFLQQVYQNLSLLEQDVIIKSENVAESELHQLRKDIDICKDIDKEGHKFSELLDTVKQHSSSTEADIIMHGVMAKMSSIDSTLDKQRQKGEVHLQFKQNPSLIKMKSLGHLSVCQGESNENKATGLEAASDEINMQDDPQLTSPETVVEDGKKKKQATKGARKPRKQNKKSKFSVCAPGDVTKSCIVGIITLQDGRLVAADQSNRKIKVFSSSDFKLIGAHSLENDPVDFCKTGPISFAIVFKKMKMIERYTINGKNFKLERSWKTKYQNFAVAMDREYYAVLCMAEGNVTGDIRLQIRRDTDCKVLLESIIGEGCEEELFTHGCSICCTGDKIIVLSKKFGLSIFRRNNLESLENIRMLYPYYDSSVILKGLASDKEGNLYFCSPSSRCVYEVDAKEYISMQDVVSGIDRPAAVYVSNKKDRMFVGCENDNYLHVFYLKQ